MRQLILIAPNQLPSSGVFGRDLAMHAYKTQLGSNQQDIYWDAQAGLHPNAFAAVAGSIKRGHNLYLHLPQHYPNGDPDHQRMLDYGIDIHQAQPHFNQRLLRLASDQTTAPTPPQQSNNPPNHFSLSPQAILGKRGRGKSTWLAHKIQWLQQQHRQTILLVSTYAAHCQQILSLVPRSNALIVLPPDEACRLLPNADYLIIDEAAAIPTAQLLALLQHYPHFSLASSEDGYEGSARIFSLHTLPTIKANYPLDVITLNQGQRYHSNDNLEQLIERIFLHQQTAPTPKPHSAPQLRSLSPAQLAHDDHLLSACYQLLFSAHYRTRPDDLKRLLDLPNQHLFALFADNTPLAIIHLLIEQPLPTELAQAVITNTRRPQGRLLMQQLLRHTHNHQYSQQPLVRIQRIATHPAYRRRGFARRLIQHSLDTLPYPCGVSYGHSPALGNFWQQLGFKEIYRSPKISARSGRANAIRLHT